MRVEQVLQEADRRARVEDARLVFLGSLPLALFAKGYREGHGIVDRDPSVPVSRRQRAELTARWPDAHRLLTAITIATDIAACCDLLAGRTVDPGRLDADTLAKAREASLVRLERPIDLVDGAA